MLQLYLSAWVLILFGEVRSRESEREDEGRRERDCFVVGLYRIREEATESDERLKKGRSELIVVLVR